MIETSAHQIEQPTPIERDSRGVLIQPELTVAYNKSGNVTIGQIVEVTRNEWKVSRPGVSPKTWWSLKFEMKIRNIDDPTQVTTVKNPNSFVTV